ncbi:hypothetical protein [Pseudonocardia spinosispora]|uniref:hypothetical protein n=1 Tax=Pseudonocardia spinosispora TaxID=103441 RepID=UPI000427D9A8|nr:hypothetical protein [Pseudonocardia spinosispora]
MSERGDATVCQLDGCTNMVEQAERGEERRYCCVSHRKTARRRRKGQHAKAAARPDADPPVTAAPSPRTDPPDSPGPVNAPTRCAEAPDSLCSDARLAEGAGTDAARVEDTPRALVPQPRSRWLGRPLKSYAARGRGKARARYSPPPLPTQPDWLKPADPPDDPDPATFTARTLAQWWGSAKAEVAEHLARRRAAARQRKTEAAIAHKDAEAVPPGTEVLGEATTSRRTGQPER